MPADKTTIANSLVTELAFMAGTLAELRQHINDEGAIEHFKQGKQEFLERAQH